MSAFFTFIVVSGLLASLHFLAPNGFVRGRLIDAGQIGEAKMKQVDLSQADAVELATERLWLEGLSLPDVKRKAALDACNEGPKLGWKADISLPPS
ncbi:MAG: hypothetical protein AAFY56_17995 [Pseudomonadota bacterium]